MKLIVDANGGDLGCAEVVKGAVSAVDEFGYHLILVGDESSIQAELGKYTYDKRSIDIVPASDIINNDEEPVLAVRKKKNSSIVVGAELLRNGEGDGFLSSGSTGALLASGIFILKRIPEVERPAITIMYPTSKGFTLLMDAGANMDCKPEYLLQFALMASVYCREVLRISNPKVGLLNVGAEEGKGNKLVKEAYALLRSADLNFVGNLEPRDLPAGVVDIAVCDGFVGNTVLKLTEGVVIEFQKMMKDAIMRGFWSKLGGLMIKKSINNMKKSLDYREHGGAPLLGISKPVFKAHGSSDAFAYKNGIRAMAKFCESDVISKIEVLLKQGRGYCE